MNIVERVPSKTVFELIDNVLLRVNDNRDLTDLTIILTLLLYARMMMLGEVETTEEFLSQWVTLLRRNIELFDGVFN